MYISETELENYLKRDLTAKESASFVIIEEAARIAIDNYCDTNWDSDASSESRYYDGGLQEISIDPCKTITEVAYVDEDFETDDEFDTDEYVAEPVNKTIKTSLRLRAGRFCRGIKNIKVTAVFSSYDDAVPGAVKLACLKLCAGAIQNPVGITKENIEGYGYELAGQVQKDEEIQNILAPYRQVLL